jgi:hypothetical protein
VEIIYPTGQASPDDVTLPTGFSNQKLNTPFSIGLNKDELFSESSETFQVRLKNIGYSNYQSEFRSLYENINESSQVVTSTILNLPAPSFGAAATGTNSIATIPTHQAGSLILAYAFKGNGDCTSPPTPTNSGWTSVGLTTAQDGTCSRLSYRIANSPASITTETWSNTTSLIYAVYNGFDANLINNFRVLTGTTTQAQFNLNSTSLTTGSWVLGFVGGRANTANCGTLTTLPSSSLFKQRRANITGTTNLVSQGGANARFSCAAVFDTNGPITSSTWSAQQSGSMTANNPWQTFTIELKR